jgi:hypothetical protein
MSTVPLDIARRIEAALAQPREIRQDDRLRVESVDAGGGLYCWQITARTKGDVQAQIARLMSDPLVARGEFSHPNSINASGLLLFVARGWTQDFVGTASEAAE